MPLPRTLPEPWTAKVEALARTLQEWPWLETLQTLRQRFREDRLGITASSLTFTTTIALVPLFTVMLAAFSAFPMFARFQDALQNYFVKALVPDTIAKPVLNALTQFAAKSSQLGALGFVILFFTALTLMLTIDRSLNAIWRVRAPRPIAQRVLVYWAAATLGPLLLGISLTVASLALTGLADALHGGLHLLIDVTEFLLLAVSSAALFHYVPNTFVQWRHALAGGAFVAAGLEIAKRALGWYVAQVPSYAIVYGAFATVPIFLIWIYCSWVIVLWGAVIAAYAPSLSMRIVRRPAAAGDRFMLALTVIGELRRARALGRGGVSGAWLAEALRTDPLQIEPVLDLLIELDWVGRLEEGGSQRHVLIVEPAQTRAAPLLAKLLLEQTPITAPLWRRAGLEDLTVAQLLPD